VTRGADPYKTLQVDPEAEDDVIAAAYRRLARKYHPDVASDDATAARMAAINTAWATIGDPAKRAAYDRDRAAAASTAPASTAPAAPSADEGQKPETVSRDWTPGRSTIGGGYDTSMRQADGEGAAGPPPGNPTGSVINFGRYVNWSLGEIARRDIEYIEWLDRAPIGRQYREELDAILRRAGRRHSADAESSDRRGLFRRR
jgi:curved DNA-binding protein CbpA